MPLVPHEYANADDNILFQAIKQSKWDITGQLLHKNASAQALVQQLVQYDNIPLHGALG